MPLPMSLTVKLILGPLLVLQALRTRKRIPRLDEAAGKREGIVGEGDALLRLLVIGDSSAAGVGVPHQREALAEPMARSIAAACGLRVHWRLLAQTGLTSAQLAPRLSSETDLPTFDIAVVVSGVNDVVDQVPTRRAIAQREALANQLRNRLGVMHVVFAPLPPVHHFHGLPQPLRWVAGADARRHDRALAEWSLSRSDVSHAAMELSLNRATMASDGFHPGLSAYRQAAHELARHVSKQVWPQLLNTHGGSDDAEGTQPARQDLADYRREPRHRAGGGQARGRRRRQHRPAGQDDRARSALAGHAVQRR
jgi:lysophospholipase L1-like esterase